VSGSRPASFDTGSVLLTPPAEAVEPPTEEIESLIPPIAIPALETRQIAVATGSGVVPIEIEPLRIEPLQGE